MLHRPECRFEERSRSEIERAHIEIIAPLSTGPIDIAELRRTAGTEWTELHQATLRMLRRDGRIEFEAEHSDTARTRDHLELVPPDEIADRMEPSSEPMQTIYEQGSVPGAHDNSVFAMVAYYSSKGLSWNDTREQVLQWLQQSGTWDRGGFEEETPGALVDSKRHVFEQEYGWREKATAAKRVIDNSNYVE